MRTPENAERSRGFTLIELLTVIAIIGILAAILIPVGEVDALSVESADVNEWKEVAQSSPFEEETKALIEDFAACA